MTRKGVMIRLRCTGRVVARIPDIRLMRVVMLRMRGQMTFAVRVRPLTTVVGPGPW